MLQIITCVHQTNESVGFLVELLDLVAFVGVVGIIVLDVVLVILLAIVHRRLPQRIHTLIQSPIVCLLQYLQTQSKPSNLNWDTTVTEIQIWIEMPLINGAQWCNIIHCLSMQP